MVSDDIKTVVSSSDERIQDIASNLLDILKGESIFNLQNLAEPEIPLHKMASTKGLLFVCESLSVPLDLGDVSRLESVVCDVFILLPNQPMVILTFVDGSVGGEATAYNTRCAGAFTRTLSRYLDVNLEVLYRSVSVSLLADLLAFDSLIKDIAKDCSLFVTKDSLLMNALRYEMCLKAFWTKIAEAKVLSEMDGHIEERKLRFLTESQYDILLNNLDKTKVEISSEPGSGARTLMVETARRLNRVSPTLVVCDSLEERDTLRSKYYFVKTSEELRTSDLLKFSCILDGTGSACVRSKGRLWTFRKDRQSSEDKRDLISTIEEQLERKRGLLTVLISHDEREGLEYILREVDTLILMKTSLKEFVMNYRQLVLDTETGQKKIDDPDSETSTDVAEHCGYYAQRLNEGLSEQRELFPLLSESSRRIKEKKSYLTSKISYLDDVVSLPEQKEQKTPGIIKEEEALVEQTSKPQTESGTSKTQMESGTDEGLENTSSEEVIQIQSDETQMKGETSEEETKEVKELEKKLEDLKERAEIQWKKIEAAATQMDDLLPWEFSLDSVSEKLTANALGAYVSEETGFGFIVSRKAEIKPFATDGRCRPKSSVTLLRQFQHGELRQQSLLKLLDETMRADYDEFSKLQRKSDRLENITGYPIYIVGTVENIKSSYISCPNMVLDKKRVNPWLKVFGDRPLKLKVLTEKDGKEHTQQFMFYEGTCSEPIYHRTTSLTIPRYWEAHVRLRVIGRVTVWEPLFEIAICQESQLDIQPLLSNNKYQPHSWSVTVADCYSHRPGVCTRVFRYGQRVRKCWDNTLEHVRGSGTVLRFGVVLDVSRGRLAFLDLVKEFLLQRFDEEFTEDLYPMFGIDPDKDDCDVEIELVSGNQVQITDRKRDLIQRALFSQ